MERRRLMVVSNRLPLTLAERAAGTTLQPGSGGLITALAPVLRDRGGVWIGWTGGAGPDGDELFAAAAARTGYKLYPLHLSAEQVRLYYDGFCNEVLWPLLHDQAVHCNFDPEYWRAYQEVNQLYAELTVSHAEPDDFIWVHDYHLMPLGSALRSRGAPHRTGFFLHTPFPSPDIFLQLPWRAELLAALLEYDLLGFQTMRDRRNFQDCLAHFWPELGASGRGAVVALRTRGREVRIGSFPISIDFRGFAEHADSKEVKRGAERLHTEYPGQQLLLGVDRLDYTKGIPLKLEAFRRTLVAHPDLRRQVTLVQIVVPSRSGVGQYQSLKESIEQLVGRINGEFAQPGWVPIQYHYRSLSRTELLMYYRASEIALVTPLKDGMNLVAKEYCAANPKGDGVLVLSEFAGAVAQLVRWAIVVNPHDVEEMARAFLQAVRMSKGERRKRMKSLRASVRDNDIYGWVNRFLEAGITRKLADFPFVADYRPTLPMDLPGSAGLSAIPR